MSTQPGDSQKSLLIGDCFGCSELLLDSAADLKNGTAAVEPLLDRKRSGALLSSCGSLTAVDEFQADGSPSILPSISTETDGMFSTLLMDAVAVADRSRQFDNEKDHPQQDDDPLNLPSTTSWCAEQFEEVSPFISSESSAVRIALTAGPSSSGATGRTTRDMAHVSRRAELTIGDALGPEVSTGSDVLIPSPSQRTTAGESSIQTSTQSEVDGHGFIILEGTIDRLPPFVHYDPPSDRTATRRNAKWRTMLDEAEDKWRQICQNDSQMLKRRVRKGIPKDWRYRAWPLLSGGRMLQKNNPNTYARLVRSHCEFEDKIMIDLNRTLPTHIYFVENNGAGQRALFNCLKAYAIYDPEVGYVQGMGSLMAPLLLTMSEEDAFWTFAALMCEQAPEPRPSTAGPHPGCRRLFLDGLPLTHELISKLKHLASEKLSHLVSTLENYDLSFCYLTTKWWMTLFCFVLPFQHVLRVWDVFFLEGWKMALRTGLVILKCMEARLRDADEDLTLILDASSIARSLPTPDAFIKLALGTRISKTLLSWDRNTGG